MKRNNFKNIKLNKSNFTTAKTTLWLFVLIALFIVFSIVGKYENQNQAFDENNISLNALSGSGTSSSPYLLTSQKDFQILDTDFDGDASSGLYFKMNNDISLDATWRGIDDFKGTFDGNNHCVTFNNSKQGIFASTSSATIKNVFTAGTILSHYNDIDDNIDWMFDGYFVGSIAGNVTKCEIMDCHNNCTIKAINSVSYSRSVCIGGIIGRCSANISRCSNSGTIIVEGSGITDDTGEDVIYYIAGIAADSYDATISDCYNCGEIISEIKGEYRSESDVLMGNVRIGGILNCISGTSTISHCYNTGLVYDWSNNIAFSAIGGIGGLVGSYSGTGKVEIVDCFNVGDIYIAQSSQSEGTPMSYGGGIVGCFVSESIVSVSNCHSVCSVVSGSGGTSTGLGGIVGNNKSLTTIKNCVSNSRISGTATDDIDSSNIANATISAEVFHLSTISDVDDIQNFYTNGDSTSTKITWTTGWDFSSGTGAWSIATNKNNGYPFLQSDNTSKLIITFSDGSNYGNSIITSFIVNGKSGESVDLAKINFAISIGYETTVGNFSLDSGSAGTLANGVYTFGNADGKITASNPTLRQITYTIAYNLDGGEWGSGVTPKTTYTFENSSYYYTLPTPTKKYYKFLGWTSSSFNTITPSTNMGIYACSLGNFEFTAHWEIAKSTITLSFDVKCDREFIVYILDENDNANVQLVVHNGTSYSFTVQQSKKYTIFIYQTIYSTCTINDETANTTEISHKKVYANGTNTDRKIKITITAPQNINNWTIV